MLFFFGQDWIAFIAAANVFTFSGDNKFENTGAPLEENGFAYCQVMRTGEGERERERERENPFYAFINVFCGP